MLFSKTGTNADAPFTDTLAVFTLNYRNVIKLPEMKFCIM